MRDFIVWSCGAVRKDLIEQLKVPPEDDREPFFVLTNGSYPTFPRADLPDVLNQLRGLLSLGSST